MVSPKTAHNHPDFLNKQSWEIAREKSVLARSEKDIVNRAVIAKEGMAFADSCVMRTPEESACYYYRAINTNIYIRATGKKHEERKLKTIISDLKRVIALNDKFDHGGAYRNLGRLYSENGLKDTLTAISYLEKAVQTDANYPENHIYLAQAMLDAGMKEEAREHLKDSISLVSQWKTNDGYPIWVETNKAISQKLD